MKINDLKNSFEAISPTAEQKGRMLTKILKRKRKAIPKIFEFGRMLATAGSLVAVIAISVVAFNYGDFNINEENNMVVHKTEETVQKNTIKEENAIKKSEKTEKKSNDKKTLQVASAKPVTENKTEGAQIDAPAPISMSRTIVVPEDISIGTSDNSGIAIASEIDVENNYGIDVVLEDSGDGLEWNEMPSLEETEKLEEENINSEENKDEEEIEKTEEIDEETE